MNRIKVLAEDVANKIAAGEVVERPASVVKELVENSIDALANRITIYVDGGGKKQIKVVDNGTGMSADDAIMAFERHATSKVATLDDIFKISTLGFRGEALASIASVSNLTLITKAKNSEVGTKVCFKYGRLIDVSECAANIGTTICVEGLFRHLPARRRFLKSRQVEFNHIFSFLHHQSILNPKIHFKLFRDNKLVFNYPIVKNLDLRLRTIFGKRFMEKELITLRAKAEHLTLRGYLGTFEYDQSSFKNINYLFVNGRYIRDRIVFHSIRKALEPLIFKFNNRLPFFILFLEIDPSLVDFNVHPAKQEVRFRDAGLVHSFVQNSIKSAFLEFQTKKYDSIKNLFDGQRGDSFKHIGETFKKEQLAFDDKNETLIEQQILSNQEVEKAFLTNESDAINPWQLHQAYIFLQDKDGLMVVDQHAAHERIIFERTIQKLNGLAPTSQRLLLPIVLECPVELRQRTEELLKNNLELFEKVGFSIKAFSGDSIVIDEVPVELSNIDNGGLFWEILQNLDMEYKKTDDIYDAMAKSIACKAAIKAGEKLSKSQMLELINDLFACQVPFFCPHGRPLLIKLPVEFFEKKFKRV